ncbi:MAG: hypothetical protein NC206_09105 [Bacteroides sp.]|nr:hypothetical protein [Roseburia sp.]MCM1347228.1 hypothetical protein [Bacteroides sp.]MCM1421700.1 hypothetical protein [Bacteroides sp.]
MIFDMELVRKNSRKVYAAMACMCRYSFEELEKLTSLGCTELCLALSLLLREGRIEQGRDADGIRYVPVRAD